MSKYIVTLSYETKVIIEYKDGSGREWEIAAMLEAEAHLHPSAMQLTDWTVEKAKATDKREADNV